VLPHIGQDGLAVGGRCVDHGEVAYAGQRHLEGARDGAGRERQDVDTFGQSLHRLFVGDPETLLLVDDQQAEPFEATSSERSRCVPMTTSTDPVGQPATTFGPAAGARKRRGISTRTG
jgi:hypothetical protein